MATTYRSQGVAAESAIPLTPEQLAAIPQTGRTFTGSQGMTAFAGDVPQTGLIGSEQALTQSADAALAALRSARNQSVRDMRGATSQARGDINRATSQSTGYLQPFQSAGSQALDPLSALSGAKGQAAFDQAYTDSPYMRFLQEQGERAVTRNSAALGGLRGGNVMKELTRFGQGLSGQGLQQQINNLQNLSGMGLQAGGQMGSLAMQGGSQLANAAMQGAQNLGNLRASAANQIGNVFGQTGSQLSQGRTAAGNQLSALAALEGQSIAQQIGSTGGNLANLLAGIGGQQAGLQTDLSKILANIATGSASTIAGLPGIPGIQERVGVLGNLGQAAAGAGALITAVASDVRLKENIVPLGEVNGINLYSWDWNETGSEIAKGQPTIGVIAQELALTHPDLVIEGEDGYLRVDYGRLMQ